MVDELLNMWGNSKRVPFDVFMREVPAMCHSIDDKGYLMNVSNLWAERLGYRAEEMIGRKSVDFLTPASRKYAEDVTLPKFFETGRMHNIRYVFQDSDGEPVPVIMSAVALTDEGDFGRSIAVMFDNGIAEKIGQIEAVLQQSITDMEEIRHGLEANGLDALDRILVRLNNIK
jgi:PAS domain S-box-containing protein